MERVEEPLLLVREEEPQVDHNPKFETHVSVCSTPSTAAGRAFDHGDHLKVSATDMDHPDREENTYVVELMINHARAREIKMLLERIITCVEEVCGGVSFAGSAGKVEYLLADGKSTQLAKLSMMIQEMDEPVKFEIHKTDSTRSGSIPVIV